MAANPFKKLNQWWNDAQNLWALVILAFPTAGATVSGWTAYVRDEPWNIILLYSSGVFCFLIVGFANLFMWMRTNTVYGKIRFESLSAMVGKVKPDDKTYVVTASVALKNYSLFYLYYSIEEAVISLQRRVPDNRSFDKSIMPILSGGTSVITFQSIDGLLPEAMTGEAILKLRYGKSRDSLVRSCKMVAQPHISLITNKDGEVAGAASNMFFRELINE